MSLRKLAALLCVVFICIFFIVGGLCFVGATIILSASLELCILIALLIFLLVLGAILRLAEFYKEIRD